MIIFLNCSGVARICCAEGQRLKCYGHSRWTSGPGAAAARWLIVLWLMQYWLKEPWVVEICISWSRRLHNTWIVDSQIWKSRGRGACPCAPQLATPLMDGNRDALKHRTAGRSPFQYDAIEFEIGQSILSLTYNVFNADMLDLRYAVTWPLTLWPWSFVVYRLSRDQTLYQIVAKSKIQRLIMAILILKICGPTQQPS